MSSDMSHSGAAAVPARTTHTLAKSAIVGVVASLVDLVVLGLSVEVFGVAKSVANIPALTLGLLVQFLGNKLYAFDDRSKDLARQGSLFLLIEAGAFGLNAGLFHLLGVVAGWPWWLARALASGAVYFGFSYPLWGYVFRPGRTAAGQ